MEVPRVEGGSAVWEFDAQAYGPDVAALLEGAELPELGPGSPRTGERPLLQALDDSTVLGGRAVRDASMAACCRSGLWLLHDFLDDSHRISQSIGTASGSFWHGIMHRREPDYSNAKYWFRRVGTHPTFPTLREASQSLARVEPNLDSRAAFLAEQTEWDPAAFVDLCRQVAAGGCGAESLARRVSLLEWQILFDYCWRHAAGEGSDGG